MPARSPHTIVLDDHPLTGRGIAQYLQTIYPELPVRVMTEWAELELWMENHGSPEVLVADVWLADSNSLLALAEWRTQGGYAPWLAISGDENPFLPQQVRSAGAQGFVHKQAPPEVFARAFSAVLEGREWFKPWPTVTEQHRRRQAVSSADLGLTTRQGEVFALVLQGLPNKRIASLLELSECTVKEHMTGIFRKLGVGNRVQAITLLEGRQLSVDRRRAGNRTVIQ